MKKYCIKILGNSLKVHNVKDTIISAINSLHISIFEWFTPELSGVGQRQMLQAWKRSEEIRSVTGLCHLQVV